jgi:hypothetical protein
MPAHPSHHRPGHVVVAGGSSLQRSSLQRHLAGDRSRVVVGGLSGRRPVAAGGPPSEGHRAGSVVVEVGRREAVAHPTHLRARGALEVAWRQRCRCRGRRGSIVVTGPSLQGGPSDMGPVVAGGPPLEGGHRRKGRRRGQMSSESSQASSSGAVRGLGAVAHTPHAFASEGASKVA